MKLNLKRCLAGAMVLVLTISLLPAAALAAYVPPEGYDPIMTVILDDLPEAAGQAPTGLQYTIYEKREQVGTALSYTHVLVFSKVDSPPEGATFRIPDYTNASDRPWKTEAAGSTYNEVYLEAGITGIGQNAFSSMTSLETVTIEDLSQITTIGERAFSGDSRADFVLSDGTENQLDLSQVDTLGTYAFNGCSQLAGVTLSGDLPEIPAYAFQSTGLETIEIPEGVTTIGAHAFENCQLSKITLPSTVEEIQEYAFARPSGSPNTALTELTIPENVTSIGAHAFYNYQGLATVTIEGDSLSKPGSGAFGDSQFTAHTRPGQIEVGDEMVEATLGTTFISTGGADLDALLENNGNCYLGDVSPMVPAPEYDVAPTCLDTGRKAYQLTYEGSTAYYYQDVPALGHQMSDWKKVDPTCTDAGYETRHCTRPGCTATETRYHSDDPAYAALGHDYQVSSVSKSSISVSGDTIITYTCGRNIHTAEQPYKTVPFTIPGTALTATTTQSLNDLLSQLSSIRITGSYTGQLSGSLSWDEAEIRNVLSLGLDDDLPYSPEGLQVPVIFKSTLSESTFPYYGDDAGEALTITVQVEKTVLDLSEARVNTYTGYVGNDPPSVTAEGMPSEAKDSKVQYREDSGAWTDDQPTNDADNVNKNFDVGVYFTYDDTIYRLPQSSEAGYPTGDGYTLEESENGTAYLVHDYTVQNKTFTPQITSLPLVYDPEQPNRDTISVSGLPAGATVKFYHADADGNPVGDALTTETYGTAAVTGFPQTNAGEWKVYVEITYDAQSYVPYTAVVTAKIDKKSVSTPGVLTTTQYTNGHVQQGVDTPDSNSEIYTYTGYYRAENAGDYDLVLTLKQPENYRWQLTDAASTEISGENGAVATISWSIAKRTVVKPTLIANTTFTYNGDYWRPVGEQGTSHGGRRDIQYTYEGTKLIATYTPYVNGQWEETNKEEIFTITDGQGKDAGTYNPQASLSDTNNYMWQDGTTADYSVGQWVIQARGIPAPILNATDMPYNGGPYDTSLISYTGESADLVGDELKVTGYTYYDASGTSQLTKVPSDVGSYRILPVYALNDNYTLYNNTPTLAGGQFSITKASLELIIPSGYEGDGKHLEYTGRPQEIDGVIVSGTLYGQDAATKPYTVYYSVSKDGGDYGTETTTLPILQETGTYTIKARLEAKNYEAAEKTYQVVIGAAETQEILLDPGEDVGDWTGAPETGYTMTKTLGEQATFTVTGKGTVDSSASITYQVVADSVKDGDGQTAADPGSILTVDENGVVTIHGAGTATVEVRATKTSLAGAATTTYQVKIEKGTPEILREPVTATYDGEPLDAESYEAERKVPDFAPAPTGDLTYAFYLDQECANPLPGGTDAVPVAAGSYYLKITSAGDKNYLENSKEVAVTIQDAKLTVQAEDYEAVYDGASHPLSDQILSVTGPNDTALDPNDYEVVFVRDPDDNSETPPESWDASVSDFRHVSQSGIYCYRVTAENYGEAVGWIRVTVTPKPLTVEHNIEEFSKVYDGGVAISAENPSPTILTLSDGETPVESKEIAVSNVSAAYISEDVGTGNSITVTATLTAGADTELSNYDFGESVTVTDGQMTLTLTEGVAITKKPITVTGVEAVNRTYNGETEVTLGGTLTSADIEGNDKVTFTPGTGTMNNADAGEGKAVTVKTTDITLGGDDAKNYQVNAIRGTGPEGQVTVDIAQKEVTLTPPDEAYREADYTGLPLRESFYHITGMVGLVADDGVTFDVDDIAYTFGGSAEVPIVVGTYDVTASLQVDEETQQKYRNYKVETATYQVTITNVGTVEVAAQSYEGTYDGKSHLDRILEDWDFQNYLTGAEPTVTFIRAEDGAAQSPGPEGSWQALDFTDAADSGTYWFKVTAERHVDFYSDEPVTITILPREITVIPDLDVEKAYDGTATYAGKTPTATVTTGVEGESFSAVYVTGSAVYDDAAADPDRTITLQFTLTGGSGTELDNYAYQKTGLSESEPIQVTVDGKIIPREITVEIQDYQREYDGALPSLPDGKTYWVLGEGSSLASGENPEILGITLTIGGDSANAGKYPITGDWTNKNYAVTFNGSWAEGDDAGDAGTYTIQQKPITLQIGAKEGYYGNVPDVDDVQLTLAEDSEMATGETVEMIRDTIELTAMTAVSGGTAVTDRTDMGNYSIVGSVTGGNYKITFTGGSYVVKRRPITITLADQSSPYGCQVKVDQTAYSDTYTGGTGVGILGGEDLGIQLSTAVTTQSKVGFYDIVPSAMGTDANNYDITWVGDGGPLPEGNGAGRCGRYEVTKANIAAAFTLGDQEENGIPISYQQTYSNSLEVTNQDSGSDVEDLVGAGISVEYSTSDTSVATVSGDGTVTLQNTGTVTITATVNAADADNYTGEVSTWYILHIAQDGGGTGISVLPAAPLTYNGALQTLVTVNNPNHIAADITYIVTDETTGDPVTSRDSAGRPTAVEAGNYQVSWTATPQSSGYSEQGGTFTVTIQQATLNNIFDSSRISVPYSVGGIYSGNLEQALVEEFDGTVTYSSSQPLVASFDDASNYMLTLHDYGETTIHADLTDSRNYRDAHFTYILEVTSADKIITYQVTDFTGIYNRQPHTIDVAVDHPAGAVVYYKSTENSDSYTTQTPPTFTDVGKHTVYFRIEAPGCTPVESEGTVDIQPKPITADMFQDSIAASYTYIGSQIQPPVEVIYEGVALTEGVDYTVEYGPNLSDTGSVIVKAIGSNFTGSDTVTFNIAKRDADFLSASLDNYFGFVGQGTNTAIPTVMFAGEKLDYSTEYTVTCAGASVDPITGTVDFTSAVPGRYEIVITPAVANFSGTLTLPYYLLTAEDGALLANLGAAETAIYGEPVNGSIRVTDTDGTPVPEAEYTLTYTYYPNDSAQAQVGDYTPAMMQNADAGLYVVKATGKVADAENGVTGVYAGQSSIFVFLILPRDLGDSAKAQIIVTGDTTYTGSPVEPEVSVAYGGAEVGSENYAVHYGPNTQPGEGYVWVSAAGNNYVGAALQTFEITSPTPDPLDFTLVVGNRQWTYDGNANAGSITVYSEGSQLTPGTDYTLTILKDGVTILSDCGNTPEAIGAIVNVGSYTVTANGTGDYTGLTSSVPVAVSPGASSPTLTVVSHPTYLYGGGTTVLTVTVSNPTDLDSAYLTVQKNGVSWGTVPLMSSGAGVYTAYYNAPNESAVYTFTATHEGLTVSTILTVTASGGSQGGGDHGGDSGSTHYIIEADAGIGGSISPNGRVSVSPGSNKTFHISADDNYVIADVLVDGESVGAVSQYTFEDVRKDHTITVLFRSAQESGMVDPSITGVADWLNTVDHNAFLSGYSGGTFQPNAPMTRAEAAQMFYNLLLDQDISSSTSYRDISSSDWYAQAVGVMSTLGIITGYEDNTFRPQASITRGEFAALALRFAREVDGAPVTFTDVSSGDWYYRYVTGAAAYGWITGYEDGSFRPMNSITRAEVATIANRMLGRIPDESYINSHLLQVQQFTDLGLPHWAFYQIMEAANGHSYRKSVRSEAWTALR